MVLVFNSSFKEPIENPVYNGILGFDCISTKEPILKRVMMGEKCVSIEEKDNTEYVIFVQALYKYRFEELARRTNDCHCTFQEAGILFNGEEKTYLYKFIFKNIKDQFYLKLISLIEDINSK